MSFREKDMNSIKEKEINNIENVAFAYSPLSHFKPLKILIVEDNEIWALFIKTIITTICREVLFARTGFEAIETSLNNPDIDLILMDINLPELNGHEATKHIRLFNKEVIIFAQTSNKQCDEREKAIEAGCDDFISKTYFKDQFHMLLHRYFKNQSVQIEK